MSRHRIADVLAGLLAPPVALLFTTDPMAPEVLETGGKWRAAARCAACLSASGVTAGLRQRESSWVGYSLCDDCAGCPMTDVGRAVEENITRDYVRLVPWEQTRSAS